MEWLDSALGGLIRAKSLAVLTGAGISAESGIPTFRGKDGLWKNYRAEELATPYAFKSNPKLVWEWYNWRREIISKAKPNKAHYAIAELETIYKDFILITQNVDDLHRRAGSKKIIELHGNIFRTRCSECGKKHGNTHPPAGCRAGMKTRIDTEVGGIHKLPICDCGGLLRPDIVWFGESIPNIEEAFSESSECDFMLVVGTSGIVEPAASLPRIAKSNGAFVLEINLAETPITQVADYSIFDKAGKILPELINSIKKAIGRTSAPTGHTQVKVGAYSNTPIQVL
ncbi:NAD-dependent deacylase [candidate division WOR-3 bacterium]|nr:NAD-dependent deacylase [candidate division WOR-3 bacterium]